MLGRNGAGKTTTVSTIVGFVEARAGAVRFKGEDVSRIAIEGRAQRGMALVPQGRRVFPLLTVEENLGIAQRAGKGPWTLQRIYAIFPRLQERRTSLGSTLSGGERQMLAIGRALMASRIYIMAKGRIVFETRDAATLTDELRDKLLGVG